MMADGLLTTLHLAQATAGKAPPNDTSSIPPILLLLLLAAVHPLINRRTQASEPASNSAAPLIRHHPQTQGFDRSRYTSYSTIQYSVFSYQSSAIMDDLDLAAESLADKVQRFSAFIGVTKPTPRDKFFLVMGMTGSGKSTFVARCTGQAVTVGHGLYSCKILP